MTYTPFDIFGESRDSRWLITVDHASNFVPPEINGGDLGIGAKNMERHIAFDIGARGTSLHLGDLLNAPVICSNFSRLVIDPNRGEEDPTQVMMLYDGTIVPANRHVDHDERERRREAYYRPYHEAIEGLAARRDDVIIVAMHSFSPRLNGKQARPWHIGVLHAPMDGRIGVPLIKRLEDEGDICVGDNEPYSGYLPGDSVDRHALGGENGQKRLNALIEIRQDLIADETGERAWAERLARVLPDVLETTKL